jgi:signal transduction histidine kinase
VPRAALALRTGGDEFDRLAPRINATLDRLRALMATLREVTDDIAHDLRTPLTRLRQCPDDAARALIDKVVVMPGGHPDGSPGIELVGQPMDVLKAAPSLSIACGTPACIATRQPAAA